MEPHCHLTTLQKLSDLHQPNELSYLLHLTARENQIRHCLSISHGLEIYGLHSTGNRKATICGHFTRDSLLKLRPSKFDGDPLHWFDWPLMLKSIVHDANLSINVKMQHFQNSVIGKAK